VKIHHNMLCVDTVLIVAKAAKHVKYKKSENMKVIRERQEYVLWLRCVVL